MYAAWGDDLTHRLRDVQLHERLAAAGVRRLQLNLDDADVAPAMRIATGAEHIGAVVSVWADSDPEVTEALASATSRLAGWEVDERLPIPPPETPHAARLDALANVAVLKRPDDLGRDEWLHRWLVDHTPIAIATQASFGYVQNIVTRAADRRYRAGWMRWSRSCSRAPGWWTCTRSTAAVATTPSSTTGSRG